jgi:type I restriction enzyme M protein
MPTPPGRCGGGDGGPAQPAARQLGSITSRINRELTPPDIDRIAGTVHAWRQDGEVAEADADVPGFCYSAKLEEIEKNRFAALLKQQQQEGAKLDQ